MTAVPEEVVSAVLADGATAYLGTTGRLMPEKLSGAGPDPITVELEGAPREAPELAVFLSALKPLAGLYPGPFTRRYTAACGLHHHRALGEFEFGA